ncbi:MAG: helix-hairpin-helix domain-containing protein [Chloroflexi bacterium]|nr:helix-hairpin-helix domain-containing protein [Chloroflexota bacterium]
MDTEVKLEALAADARFDVCGWTGIPVSSPSPMRFIHRAALPGGGCVSLFKVLLTNVCINDCVYCVNQVARDKPRYSFQPDELAKVFMELHRKRLVQGLFLTSGIGTNPSRTMEQMIKTVEILRHRYEFSGYIHLKMLPGASFDCIEAGCRLANRVSVNIEAPTVQHLARLSTRKDLYQGILEPMQWVKRLKAKDESLVPSGQTTQFVVGAAGETDRDILRTTEALYHDISLRRAYFSAFHPIPGTRLEEARPTPPRRENRLYQADWLLRVYGFPYQEVELALGDRGNLSLSQNPKLVIARKQPWLFPVDINKASYEELLRVPGIGPTSAQRIVQARKEHSIYALSQLRKMRVVVKQAAPYIWFQGMLTWEREKQLSFLPELEEETEPEPTLAGAVG